MTSKELPVETTEEAFGGEDWLSLELSASLFDRFMPDEEQWDVSKQVEITATTQMAGEGHVKDVLKAWRNPDFHISTTVRSKDGVNDEVELLKYKVAYRLDSGEEVIQFRRQIIFTSASSSRFLQSMVGRRTVLFHSPSPDSPGELPFRFESGLFRQIDEGAVFEYRDMHPENGPNAPRGWANIFLRMTQMPTDQMPVLEYS